MRNNSVMLSVLCCILFMLTGCHRFGDWGKRTWYQGHDAPVCCDVRDYIRSTHVYDQLTTQAMFDAIVLSDEVREAYARIRSWRHAYTPEKEESLIRRQLAENDHFLTFLVIASNRGGVKR